jgi:hypothetical protein
MRLTVARLGVALLATLVGAGAVPAQNAVPGQLPIEALPEGPGREAVFYTCSACHSLQLVTQQRLSAERWDQLISWMVTENRMPEPTPAIRAVLLEYLAAAFPEEATGGPAYVNPFGP